MNEHQIQEALRIGDQMQSEGSRMAEWILTQPQVPYEVFMAAIGIRRASIAQWTELRSKFSGLPDKPTSDS